MTIYGLLGGLPSRLPLALAAAAPILPISLMRLADSLAALALPPMLANWLTVIVFCFMVKFWLAIGAIHGARKTPYQSR